VKIITPLILSHGEGGHIVNTSSMAGIVPLPLPGLGRIRRRNFVRGFTESLRMSLAPHGIGVSVCFRAAPDTHRRSQRETRLSAAAREMTAS
jgi:short-subunit dehydrogenase